MGRFCIHIEARHSWHDLILPRAQITQLRELVSLVRYGHKLGVVNSCSALFVGANDTGKSLAAEAIANELDLPLFRTDLSKVVSKYIGETEKNLSALFGDVEESNAVLFFDEADALFGNRSTVVDSNDRYANFETSLFLNRMELFRGVILVATKLKENLDSAFERRLKFVIDFPHLDSENRKRLR